MRVKVDTHPFTVEELCYNSRPEAIDILRRVEQMLEDAYDAGMAKAACECTCPTVSLADVKVEYTR